MPIQDLFSTQIDRYKLREKKAIVNAVIKYFETAPSRMKSTSEDPESLIINALHRYFVRKD
jgi:hypothetical protein